jgi:iron complex outermembrane recepter protein
LGLRGEGRSWNYNLVLYQLAKRDDLVSQRDLATNVTTNVNAGKTRHRGIEIGAGAPVGPYFHFDAAFSYATHRYMEWVTGTANFGGKDIESAPAIITNTRVTWKPTKIVRVQTEWSRLSSYWLEASNSAAFGKYPGHDLCNVRVSVDASKRISFSMRVTNAFDKRFADSASVSSNTPVFSPGLPRGYYGDVILKW